MGQGARRALLMLGLILLAGHAKADLFPAPYTNFVFAGVRFENEPNARLTGQIGVNLSHGDVLFDFTLSGLTEFPQSSYTFQNGIGQGYYCSGDTSFAPCDLSQLPTLPNFFFNPDPHDEFWLMLTVDALSLHGPSELVSGGSGIGTLIYAPPTDPIISGALVAVPEPSSLVLFAVAVLGLLVVWRFGRRLSVFALLLLTLPGAERYELIMESNTAECQEACVSKPDAGLPPDAPEHKLVQPPVRPDEQIVPMTRVVTVDYAVQMESRAAGQPT